MGLDTVRSPFPGMDPYIEQPALWSSFHSRLIVALADAIEQTLSDQYYVEVEARTYLDDGTEGVLIGIPDAAIVVGQSRAITPPQSSSVSTQVRPQQVTLPMSVMVKERYLEVRDVATHDVITVIELLSPKNKRSGEGRASYEKKRSAILSSTTHLVEIDLLRAGNPMPILGTPSLGTYRILVSRSLQRPSAELYSVELWQPLPELPIPLKAEQEALIISLQTIFDGVYSRARYTSRIDYSQPPPLPLLSDLEQQWLKSHLAASDGAT